MKHFEKWFIIAFVGATLATSCVDDIKFGDAFLEKSTKCGCNSRYNFR